MILRFLIFKNSICFSKRYRIGRNNKGGCILFYITDRIISKFIYGSQLKLILLLEIKFKEKEVLTILIKVFLKHFLLNTLSTKTDSLSQFFFKLIIRDFKRKSHLESFNFCEAYDFKNLINDPTCYKNPKNPISIDLIMTNKLKCF